MRPSPQQISVIFLCFLFVGNSTAEPNIQNIINENEEKIEEKRRKKKHNNIIKIPIFFTTMSLEFADTARCFTICACINAVCMVKHAEYWCNATHTITLSYIYSFVRVKHVLLLFQSFHHIHSVFSFASFTMYLCRHRLCRFCCWYYCMSAIALAKAFAALHGFRLWL